MGGYRPTTGPLKSAGPLEPGARVRVLAVDGLTLRVGQADAEGRDP